MGEKGSTSQHWRCIKISLPHRTVRVVPVFGSNGSSLENGSDGSGSSFVFWINGSDGSGFRFGSWAILQFRAPTPHPQNLRNFAFVAVLPRERWEKAPKGQKLVVPSSKYTEHGCVVNFGDGGVRVRIWRLAWGRVHEESAQQISQINQHVVWGMDSHNDWKSKLKILWAASWNVSCFLGAKRFPVQY